jgi:dipeptidyl-peptidase-3
MSLSSSLTRFGELAITHLDVTGFERLPLQQKLFIHHMAEAGLHGRDIIFDQGAAVNLTVKRVLEQVMQYDSEKQSAVWELISCYAHHFWAHCGIYNSYDFQLLAVPFTAEHFDYVLKELSVSQQDSLAEDIALCKRVFFEPDFVRPMSNLQVSGRDIVAESGNNFYKSESSEQLTTDEVEAFRATYPKNERQPMYGFSSQLEKMSSGEIVEHRASTEGLYGAALVRVVESLEKALLYVEDDDQRVSVETLVHVYKTGEPEDFDVHCLAWIEDTAGQVYFNQGFIEDYDDPMGIACTFQSIVAFKDPLSSSRPQKIIENVDYFEANMPFDDAFKKEKPVGLSASSVKVASMAGRTSPVLPLGICLPNSEWIREQIGSKSVSLHNVAMSRSDADSGLNAALFLPDMLENVAKYGALSNDLHTDLHEITGHGSGQMVGNVTNDDLKQFYSVIEEARADLVGLFYISDPALSNFGIIDSDVDVMVLAKIQYTTYLTNGLWGQLRRVKVGSDLAQQHMRNRQLICQWVSYINDEQDKKAFEIVSHEDQLFVKIKDVYACRQIFAQLLTEIQRVKSEGDFQAAQKWVESYGTKVDLDLHKETIARLADLNLASYLGFVTPRYVLECDDNGIAMDVVVMQPDSFLSDQLSLSQQYSHL